MQNVLVIGKVWPEPRSSAAGRRMMDLLSFFRMEASRVIFASAAMPTPFSEDLEQLGIETRSIALNESSFDEFVHSFAPTVVVFDRFTSEEQFGWRVADQCPGAVRILNTEDLHGLRFARQQALTGGRSFSQRELVNDISKREIASILRCDLSLIISAYEMELLSSFFRVDPALLFYLPFSTPSISESEMLQQPGFAERAGFVSIGNFLHAPNRDAVLYLKERIWPLIRSHLPSATVHIYGAYPDAQVMQLNSPGKGFLVAGRADSSRDVLQSSRVCLAPLRFGAGLKGKLLEAMQCGTPSVTTPVGAEGMHGELPWNGIIAESEEAIAQAAVRLYTDETLWQESRYVGYRLVNEIFARDYREPLAARIRQIADHLESHRLANFTGAMLAHSIAQNTKYMSLWIEAKNRLKTG